MIMGEPFMLICKNDEEYNITMEDVDVDDRYNTVIYNEGWDD